MYQIYSNPEGMEPTAVTLHFCFSDATAAIQDFGRSFPDLRLAIAQPLTTDRPNKTKELQTMDHQTAKDIAWDHDAEVQAVEGDDGKDDYQVTFDDGFSTTDANTAFDHVSK
ncbi:MAG: hypothetical protein HC769_31545 [Cyanobacteria bacterium CRU_2_1]|nr:hypothetical protein [Cyanobacteria bacterium CRU_2_1]